MSGSITLDPKLGVNPHLTYCPRCGGDGRELMLIGNRKNKITCPSCGTVNFGSRPSENCGKCKTNLRGGKVDRIEDNERLPGGLCEACEQEVMEHKRLVEEGGVYFKCSECGIEGVIRAEAPLAQEVRKEMNIPAPAPCGVEITCKNHGGGE